MSRREPIDWSHTDRARHDREVKAQRLAAAARELGLTHEDLRIGGGRRLEVRKHAGVPSVSEESWAEVAAIMATDPPAPASRAPRRCSRCGATGGVRQYLNGPRCPVHTPAALAGRPEPPAPSQAPRRGRLTSRTAAVVAVEQDTRLQSAKRHARTAAERARVGEQAHRLYGHLATTLPP